MTGQRPARPTAMLTALLLVALVGCAGIPRSSSGDAEVSATRPTSPSADSPSADSPPLSSSVLDELTPDDDLAFNPPAPANVRAGQITRTSAELSWDEPAPVAVPHSYSDRVVGYRVYRSVDDDIDLRPLEMTTDMRFVDGTVVSGRTYQYSVASVRELDVEGTRSYPTVTISVP